MRELRYAGLLHDFGKVGVREQVLVKEKKLYPHDLDLIRHRFAYLDQRTELEFERARAELLLAGGRAAYEAGLARLECERRTRREELARFLDTVVQANEPTVLAEGSFDALEAIGRRTFVDFDGHVRPLLEDHELQFLMIRRGNLDEQERREIESHVTHTYRFLEQIPWTRELRAIPRIAYAHHEKLNGRGYPNQATELEIPVQARIMTIADIYDALTATDRPYKRAVPRDRALDILAMEAKEGTIDPALLETFIGARVFDADDRRRQRRLGRSRIRDGARCAARHDGRPEHRPGDREMHRQEQRDDRAILLPAREQRQPPARPATGRPPRAPPHASHARGARAAASSAAAPPAAARAARGGADSRSTPRRCAASPSTRARG